MYVLLNYDISNYNNYNVIIIYNHCLQYLFCKDNGQPKSIDKSIYLELLVNILQPYISFCFLFKFIESHKILDPRNTHEKKSWTHKTPMGKNFEPTKYPREKISDPRRRDGTVARDLGDPQWHETHGSQHTHFYSIITSKQKECRIGNVFQKKEIIFAQT